MSKALPRIDGHGPIDMHVHIGPELLMRRYSPQSLAEEARREGIGVGYEESFPGDHRLGQPAAPGPTMRCR